MTNPATLNHDLIGRKRRVMSRFSGISTMEKIRPEGNVNFFIIAFGKESQDGDANMYVKKITIYSTVSTNFFCNEENKLMLFPPLLALHIAYNSTLMFVHRSSYSLVPVKFCD
jgi:hypothetical protein